MRRRLAFASATVLSILWLGPMLSHAASAEWKAGEVIDRTNWQKIEGLVPEPLLNWIKTGDSIKIGELSYDSGEFLPPACLGSLKTNVGKYDVDDNGLLVDAKTRKLPGFIDGLPFPEIDESDPNAGTKIMYNKNYYTYAVGNLFVPFQTKWVGRKTGVERLLVMDYWVYPMDGYPPAKEESNSESLEMHSIIRALQPFDIKGTNILLWRYRDKKQDSTFAFVPAIRRVRRMSPANRSDAFLGSDFCVDDAWGYGGKVNAFEWKLLRKEPQLVPFYPGPPVELKRNDEGEWATVNPGTHDVYYGFDDEGYQGAPWFPTNLIFLMRPTYILEARAKDKYYNYGTQYLWIDAEFYQPTYKVIHDRSGKYWKTEWQSQLGFQNASKKIRLMGLANMMAFDDRADHAGLIILVSPGNVARYFAAMDRNNFSLGGFQQLSK
jgi:hypothetical protein